MKADSIAESWDSETLKSVREILEAANIRHLAVIIELFFPARVCRCCGSESLVFVRPEGLCKTCWRRFCLPFTLSGARDVLALPGTNLPVKVFPASRHIDASVE
jgi:hypothetical protein